MKYSEFVELYEKLASTSGKLDKVDILADFLKKLRKGWKSEWLYLLKGRVVAEHDPREFGISGQLVVKAIAKSFGVLDSEVVERFRKVGDLGEVSEFFAGVKRQATLFSGKLSVDKVFENLRKIMGVEGKGAVDKKLNYVKELLADASGGEAKYIVRTLLGDLRVGVADALIRDAIAKAFNIDGEIVQNSYDLVNDFSEVFENAEKGENALKKLSIEPGRAVNAMLAVKADNFEDGFRICGKPCAVEHKYDGFRVMIHKKNNEVLLFTRRLENVTKQFPDIIKAINENVAGNSFILDSEVVGYEPKTKKYKPFEAISQRIKRKYGIEKLEKELPVEINVFDVLYYNGKSVMSEKFKERRKLVEKIVKDKKWVIRASEQKEVNSEEDAKKFFDKAVELGNEGIMFKNLEVQYKQGRKVGYMAKMKPNIKDLDLVIVEAEYGTGKRGGWLTSYVVACKDGSEFLEVGKVSSGLKELEQEGGTTYEEMTKLLKELIIEKKGRNVKVKPKIVVSATYQNIQKSPSYNSGYALRFPRITAYRPEKSVSEIATLKEIEKEAQ